MIGCGLLRLMSYLTAWVYGFSLCSTEPCNVTFDQTSYTVGEDQTIEVTVRIMPPGNSITSEGVSVTLRSANGLAGEEMIVSVTKTQYSFSCIFSG